MCVPVARVVFCVSAQADTHGISRDPWGYCRVAALTEAH